MSSDQTNHDFCSICQDTATDAVLVNCDHIFCHPCIQQVRDRPRTCPNCRRGITTVTFRASGLPAPMDDGGDQREEVADRESPAGESSDSDSDMSDFDVERWRCSRCDYPYVNEDLHTRCSRCQRLHCFECIGPFDGVCLQCLLRTIDFDYYHYSDRRDDRSQWVGSVARAHDLETEAKEIEILTMLEAITRPDSDVANRAGMDPETRKRVRRATLGALAILYRVNKYREGTWTHPNFVSLLPPRQVTHWARGGTDQEFLQWYADANRESVARVKYMLTAFNATFDPSAVDAALAMVAARPYSSAGGTR